MLTKIKSGEVLEIKNPQDFYIFSYTSDKNVVYLLECPCENKAIEIMRRNAPSRDDEIDYTNFLYKSAYTVSAVSEKDLLLESVNKFLRKFDFIEEYEDFDSYLADSESCDYIIVDTEASETYLVTHEDVECDPLYYLGDNIKAYEFDSSQEINFVVKNRTIKVRLSL